MENNDKMKKLHHLNKMIYRIWRTYLAKTIGCKWLNKLKLDTEGNIFRYKTHLLAQGYNKKYEIDYGQVFAQFLNQCILYWKVY